MPTPWPPRFENPRRPLSSETRLASGPVFSATVRALVVEAPFWVRRPISARSAPKPLTTVEVRPGTATTTTWSITGGAEAGTTALA